MWLCRFRPEADPARPRAQVDDLIAIEDLEAYVEASTTVLILLGSERYWRSVNCLREVRATAADPATNKAAKPLVLVHESDETKAGAQLDLHVAACPSALREFVFDGRDVLPWLRIHAFQLVTLKGISSSLLLHSPAYYGKSEISLVLPGDAERATQSFDAPAKIWCSRANLGAAEIAKELCARSSLLQWDTTDSLVGKMADEAAARARAEQDGPTERRRRSVQQQALALADWVGGALAQVTTRETSSSPRARNSRRSSRLSDTVQDGNATTYL